MLVLSRKVGNRVVVAGNIEITVVQIYGNRVRLGVTAPSDVSISRHAAPERIEDVHVGQQGFLRGLPHTRDSNRVS
jgi:carbon storage regulator